LRFQFFEAEMPAYRRPALAKAQDGAGLQFLDALEHRVGAWHKTEGQVFRQRPGPHPAGHGGVGEQRLDLAGEQQPAPMHGPVQHFHACRIA